MATVHEYGFVIAHLEQFCPPCPPYTHVRTKKKFSKWGGQGGQGGHGDNGQRKSVHPPPCFRGGQGWTEF